jgi:hypothetical protein
VDFFTAVRILIRRWPLTFLGVFVTFAATAAIYAKVTPEYEAKGEYFLLVPSLAPDQNGTGAEDLTAEDLARLNPYLGYGNLQIVGELLARKMNSQTVAESLKAQGATADYVVDIVPGQSPSLSVTTNGDSAESALHTHQLVTERLRLDLEVLQRDKGAPELSWITMDQVFEPRAAVFQRGSKIRAAAGVALLGFGGTLIGVFLVEGVISNRRTSPVRSARTRAAVLASMGPGGGAPDERDRGGLSAEPGLVEVSAFERDPTDELIRAIVSEETERAGACSFGALARALGVPTSVAVEQAQRLLDTDQLVRTDRGTLLVAPDVASSAPTR